MKKLIAAAFALTSFAAAQAAVNMPAGDAAAGKAAAAVCAACHGADGNSASAEFPRIAGQNARYIYTQLMAYKTGTRKNALMNAQAANLTPKQMADLAAYFASQQGGVSLADPATIDAGARLYRGGDAARGVVPCSGCHSPNGRGNASAGFPRLGGQHAEYTKQQLEAYRAAGRADATGTKREHTIMQQVASRLSDEDIALLSNFISGLH